MKYSFVGIEWNKIGHGALIAVIGAFMTYITTILPDLHVPPEYLPLITAFWGILANVIKKWAEA